MNVRLGLGLATIFLLAGCRTVRPYERGHLAHPTMVLDTAQGPAEEHMRSVHEGSTGGSGAAGGGCGCN
jgi:hypothetical protein